MTPTREEVERLATRFDVNAADWRWDDDHHAARDMLRDLLARAEKAEERYAYSRDIEVPAAYRRGVLHVEAKRDAAEARAHQERTVAATFRSSLDAALAEAARLREASERIANHAFNEGCRYGVYPITGGGPTAKELVAAALATEARDE